LDDNFEAVWSDIRQRLRPATVVRNWGLARGYTRATFEIKDVERTSITVPGGNIQVSRRISKGEFEKVYAVWDEYVAGNYPRSNLTNLSLNTTYIISIFRLLADNRQTNAST
jgi:hypothetical protein